MPCKILREFCDILFRVAFCFAPPRDFNEFIFFWDIFFLRYFYQAELLKIRDKYEKLKIEASNKPESSS